MAPRKNVDEETLFDRLRREVDVPKPLRVTEDIVLTCPTKAQLEESQNAATEGDSNRILLGEDNYLKLQELFDGEAPHMFAEFNKIYLEHFFDVPREQ